jgi:hypothetical protein
MLLNFLGRLGTCFMLNYMFSQVVLTLDAVGGKTQVSPNFQSFLGTTTRINIKCLIYAIKIKIIIKSRCPPGSVLLFLFSYRN